MRASPAQVGGADSRITSELEAADRFHPWLKKQKAQKEFSPLQLALQRASDDDKHKHAIRCASRASAGILLFM